MDTLASRLTKARKSRELTQEQLAERAGLAQSTIGNIESGARDGQQSLAAIAKALSISYWWLRDGTGDMELTSGFWPFSDELLVVVRELDDDGLRRAENLLRVHFDMALVARIEPEDKPRRAPSDGDSVRPN